MAPQFYTTVCGKNVLIKHKIRLKKLTLSFSKSQKAFVVTAPLFVSFSKIAEFIDGAKHWFSKVETVQQQEVTEKITPGSFISVLGKSLRVDFYPNPKSLVIEKEGVLEIHGITTKFESILVTHLKNLATEKCTQYSHEYAKKLKVEFATIAVKDMRTRFGSCTSHKHLNYCWRVVMAPEHILAYLCAHEVAHLKEMNHSKNFWKLVENLCPDYKISRKWLKQHGHKLYQNF